MKYDNDSVRKSISAFFLLCLIALLFACAGEPIKKHNGGRAESLGQKGTLTYVPVQATDKKGQLVRYQPMANPYLAQTGKINADAVNGFIAARRAIKSKQFKEAITVLDGVIENDSALAGPWVMKGDIAVEQTEFGDAEKNYQQAIKVNPLNVNAYIKLAKVLRMQGKYRQAQTVYADALNVWKDFPEAHLNLAVLYDIYLNNPLLAQRHMEAYQFLTAGKDVTVADWLEEIRSRTGAEPNLMFKEESSASHNSPSEGEKLGS